MNVQFTYICYTCMYAVRVLGICVYITYACDTVMMVKFAGIPLRILVLFTVYRFDRLLIKNSGVF
jgi:hypothetical protein